MNILTRFELGRTPRGRARHLRERRGRPDARPSEEDCRAEEDGGSVESVSALAQQVAAEPVAIGAGAGDLLEEDGTPQRSLFSWAQWPLSPGSPAVPAWLSIDVWIGLDIGKAEHFADVLDAAGVPLFSGTVAIAWFAEALLLFRRELGALVLEARRSRP